MPFPSSTPKRWTSTDGVEKFELDEGCSRKADRRNLISAIVSPRWKVEVDGVARLCERSACVTEFQSQVDLLYVLSMMQYGSSKWSRCPGSASVNSARSSTTLELGAKSRSHLRRNPPRLCPKQARRPQKSVSHARDIIELIAQRRSRAACSDRE